MTKFNFTLEELYAITNDMVKEYLHRGLSKTEKDFIIIDLLDLTKGLIKNNARRFIAKYNADELSVEQLQEIASSIALTKALQEFSFERGIHFLTFWNIKMKGHFLNEFKRCTTEKEKFHQLDCCSSDAEIDGEGNTILSYKAEAKDVAEEVSGVIAIYDLVEKFEAECEKEKGKKALYGKIIRALMVENKEVQKAGVKLVLGGNVSDDVVRQSMSRARKEFKNFLSSVNYY